jgi:hypothetical protein
MRTSRILLILLGSMRVAASARADPPKPAEWTATADLSYVKTGGNAESSTLGFKLNLARKWDKNRVYLLGGGIRASSATISYFAIGPSNTDFTVTRTSESRETAENYLMDGGYERLVSERFYWTLGAGWERNLFAGLESRVSFRGGGGYAWSAADAHAFKTALLISFTHQSETIPDPATKDSFVGLRFTGDFASKFGPEARNTFKSLLALDENLQATDDFRLTWLNTLAVVMNSRLALQVGFLAAFDNLPALVEVPRYLSVSGDVPTGPREGSVFVPLKKWDTQLTVSVVINLAPKPPVKMCPCP